MASASETSSKDHKQPPKWREVVGNLAAGAVSGCAVEAGEAGHKHSPSLPFCWGHHWCVFWASHTHSAVPH